MVLVGLNAYLSGASCLACSTSGGPRNSLRSSTTPSPVSPLVRASVMQGPL